MDASMPLTTFELGPPRQPAARGHDRPELQRWSSKRKSEEEDEPGDAAKKTRSARRKGNDSYETTDEDEDTAEESDGENAGKGGDAHHTPVNASIPTLVCTVAASPVGGGLHTSTTPQTAHPTPHVAAPGSRWTWSAARIASWSGQAGLRISSGSGLRLSRRMSASARPRAPAAPEEDVLRRTEEEVSGMRDDSDDDSEDDKLVTQDLNELMTRACSMERKDGVVGGARSGNGGGSAGGGGGLSDA